MWVRSKKLTRYPRHSLATDAEVYFCGPQSPCFRRREKSN